jgi:hypothetical protein
MERSLWPLASLFENGIIETGTYICRQAKAEELATPTKVTSAKDLHNL